MKTSKADVASSPNIVIYLLFIIYMSEKTTSLWLAEGGQIYCWFLISIAVFLHYKWAIVWNRIGQLTICFQTELAKNLVQFWENFQIWLVI